MRIGRLSLIGCSLWAVSIMVWDLAAAQASEKPTVDFIIAALKQQEANCGPSLQVKYTVDWLGPVEPGGLHYEARYIRTREIIFKEQKNGSWRSASPGDCEFGCGIVKYSYARATTVCRELAADTSGKWKTGVVTTAPLPSRLMSTPVMDPVLYALSGIGPLVEAIKGGSVRETQEAIEGQQCWRIDIPEKVVSVDGIRMAWVVWVDPGIGYCPRRISLTTIKADTTETMVHDFLEYRSIGNGVYFPMRITVRYGETLTSGLDFRAQEAVCGTVVSPEEIQVKFPSGTEVRVLPENIEYTEP